MPIPPVALTREEQAALRGKAVLITGGTTGIGRAAAELLCALGARVLVAGRHQPELDAAVSAMRAAGGANNGGVSIGEGHGLIADLTRHEDIQRLFAESDRVLGGGQTRLDFLVNCAAVPANRILDHSHDEMRYAVLANVAGMIACCQAAIPRMQAGGHIVNIGSISSDVLDKGASLYVATKSAVRGLTVALRKEMAERGIHVSLIEPGATGSGMVTESEERQRQMQAEMVMFKPEDVAWWVARVLAQPERAHLAQVILKPHRQMI